MRLLGFDRRTSFFDYRQGQGHVACSFCDDTRSCHVVPQVAQQLSTGLQLGMVFSERLAFGKEMTPTCIVPRGGLQSGEVGCGATSLRQNSPVLSAAGCSPLIRRPPQAQAFREAQSFCRESAAQTQPYSPDQNGSAALTPGLPLG